MIALPTQFKLGGRTWTVEVVKGLSVDGEACLGACEPQDCVIRLEKEQKPETMRHTFYHELCHALCFTLGWKKLNADEDKIDALGGLLYQYLTTKKGRTL